MEIYRSNRRRNSFPFLSLDSMDITTILIIFNTVIFFISLIFISIFGEDEFQLLFALQANNFFHGYLWTLLTSMFLHANFFHLFVNMISLFFIGKFLEMIIGPRRYLGLYILSGIFAGLFFAFLSFLFGNSTLGTKIFSSPETYAVGASGALFAIAGVLALLTPQRKIYFIAGPLIAIILLTFFQTIITNPGIFSILNMILTIYIFFSIFAVISFNPTLQKLSLPIEMPFWMIPLIAILPLVIISLFISLPIGNMAHLGGFIAGAGYGYYLKRKYKNKTRLIANYFSKL